MNRLFRLLLAVAGLLLVVGCAYRHPHLAPAVADANAPAATVQVGDGLHTVRVIVEYGEASGPRPAGARVVVEPPPSGAGAPWRVTWRLDSEDCATSAPLAEVALSKAQQRARSAWRLPAEAIDDPTTVVLALVPAARSGVGPVELHLGKRPTTPADVAHVPEPVMVATPRSALAVWTYPLWGFVRDVLDAPITAANQAGVLLRPTWASVFDKPARRNTTGLVVVAGSILVTVVVFYVFVAPWYFSAGLSTSGLGVLHPIITAVRWIASLPVVMAVGAALGLAVLGANEYVVGPAQTWLLRSGTGASVHRDVTPIELDRGWDAEALARYATWRRTFDYLPNWRYGAHTVEFTSPPPPPPSWTIDRVEPGD